MTGPSEPIGGRYEVERPLGAGASARTLLCRDLQDDRLVAVKELHFEHLEDWKHLDLFEREASILRRLQHHGIPRVFDFFQDEEREGRLFIVQEFIDGTSLSERIEKGPMFGQDEIMQLAVELLDILDYLHGRAPPVLHRDIKPSNILVRSNGSPTLVDFGGVTFGWRAPTQGGTTVVGTFGYMPPEQLVGQGGPASDLYALGATLLHVLTGRPPTDFPFDSGRIEVPAELPKDDPLTKLIEALLRPAPRDRPKSAAAAKALLMGTGPASEAGGALVRRDVGQLGRPGSRAVPITGSGPNFVDMGAPPRDPRGEFKDVFRNLMNPLYPKKILWSTGMHVFHVTMSGVLSFVSFGVAPAWYVATVIARRRRYTKVFKQGVFTRGSIRTADKGGVYAKFRFEYEVDGSVYSAVIEYALEMASYWREGDTVPVLYDAEDPTRACFVYR